MSGVAAIILAAGQGVRFGDEPKLLASLDGKPLVRRVAESALASAARPVVVVLGHRRAEAAAAFEGLSLVCIDNPAYRDGLSSSLKAGFAALPPETEAAVVLLGDMPRVGSGVIDRLIAAWRAADRPLAVAPTHAGRRGNPVLLDRALAPEIANLSGDTGAGPLLRNRPGVLELTVDDPAILKDVDTADALETLRSG